MADRSSTKLLAALRVLLALGVALWVVVLTLGNPDNHLKDQIGGLMMAGILGALVFWVGGKVTGAR